MDFARGLSTRVHRAPPPRHHHRPNKATCLASGRLQARGGPDHHFPPSASAAPHAARVRVRPHLPICVLRCECDHVCGGRPQLADAVTVGFRCSASTTPRARGARWWFPHGDRVPRHRPGSCADASSRLRASIPFRSIHRRAPISMMPPTQRRGATPTSGLDRVE